MLGKRSRPAIGKLAGALRSGVMDSMTSPRSPLECKMQSPRGLKMYDQSGTGLGLAVALDKPTNGSSGRGEVLAKYAICGQFPARSTPIPVCPSAQKDIKGCNKNNMGNKFSGQVMVEMELDGLDEEFTYVTCHGPNKSTTRVYYDGGEFGKITKNSGDSKVSPARSARDRHVFSSDSEPDFLSSCHLCRKALHGKDIYMYRGEKAFCSTECRQRQIGMDERKEKCRSEIARSSDLATSPCKYSGRSQVFFSAGIVAV